MAVDRWLASKLTSERLPRQKLRGLICESPSDLADHLLALGLILRLGQEGVVMQLLEPGEPLLRGASLAVSVSPSA